jgi:hypothetical protein
MFFSPIVLLVGGLCLSGLIALEIVALIRVAAERRGKEKFEKEIEEIEGQASEIEAELDKELPASEEARRRAEEHRRRFEELRGRLKQLKAGRVTYVYEIGTPDAAKNIYFATLRRTNYREDTPLIDLIKSPLWEYQNVAEIWAKDPDEAQRQVNLIFSADHGIAPGTAKLERDVAGPRKPGEAA